VLFHECELLPPTFLSVEVKKGLFSLSVKHFLDFTDRKVPLVQREFAQSTIKISNNILLQALHLKEIYFAPSIWGAVFL
jgi:hypothetical protein